jgi:hypothetical protein
MGDATVVVEVATATFLPRVVETDPGVVENRQKELLNFNKPLKPLFWLVPLRPSVYGTNLEDGEEIRASEFLLQLLELVELMLRRIVTLTNTASAISSRLWSEVLLVIDCLMGPETISKMMDGQPDLDGQDLAPGVREEAVVPAL